MKYLRNSVANRFFSGTFKCISIVLSTFTISSNFNGNILADSTVNFQPEISQIEAISDENPIDETVYITKNGKCFHKENCYCLKCSKIEIEKSQAIENEYKPCSKCQH